MDELTKKSFTGLAQFLVVLTLVIFLPAWTVFFWQGWVYLIIFFLAITIITIYFLKNDPALIKRRLAAGPGAEKEKSQQVIQSISAILVLLIMIISGLDHHFNWSHVPLVLTIVSDIFVALGFYIVFLVFKENTFTSATIEVDKKQNVITTGPYRLVRHPMYMGALLLFVFTPFALDSYYALPAALLLCIMLGVRLLDEETFLLRNLKGYKEYCKKTRYHLIPHIW